MIDSLMATGDVGDFDAAGRLFIDGRDDDMIISGAENVFPAGLRAGTPDSYVWPTGGAVLCL